MGIVTTLFVVGGNMEKMVCEPLANRQLFKVLNVNSHPSWVVLFSICLSLCLFWPEVYLRAIMLHNGQHCGSVLMNMHVCVRMCVFVDHRYTIPGSSCQEELPPWDAVSESEHWLDLGKHVQVTCQQLVLYMLCKKLIVLIWTDFPPGFYVFSHPKDVCLLLCLSRLYSAIYRMCIW